jgi:hypothetical protein
MKPTKLASNPFSPTLGTLGGPQPPDERRQERRQQQRRVQITEARPRLFSAVFSSEPVTIKARAVASVTGGAKGCILALSPTASGAATVSGSTQLALNNCDIASHSLASDSFLMSGSATVSTGCVQVAGTAATTSGLALTECAAVKEYAPVVIDPYASVAEPAVTGTCRSKSPRP